VLKPWSDGSIGPLSADLVPRPGVHGGVVDRELEFHLPLVVEVEQSKPSAIAIRPADSGVASRSSATSAP
jgi:hypothetical protein